MNVSSSVSGVHDRKFHLHNHFFLPKRSKNNSRTKVVRKFGKNQARAALCLQRRARDLIHLPWEFVGYCDADNIPPTKLLQENRSRFLQASSTSQDFEKAASCRPCSLAAPGRKF